MHILLIFVDGLGLGDNNSDINPLVRYNPRFFLEVFGHPLCKELGKVISSSGCMIPTDANLEIEGLPQSATGQAAIFTGVNASQFMGRHIAGFPGPSLAALIQQYGIMKELRQMGCRVTSANMYTPNYMELVAKRRRRHSVTTLLIMNAGLPLRSAEDMLAGRAVYQDITNELLHHQGMNEFSKITPNLAAKRLVDLSRDFEFTLFEYFQTDRCGHKQDWSYAEKILQVLDEFLFTIYLHTPSDTLVMVVSDHGNFEDFGKRMHTRNPVPTLLWGFRCENVAARINSLIDLKPAMFTVLKGGAN